MRKYIRVWAVVCALLALFLAVAGAQTPEPPSPTPVVVTATPMPQVIVVTATPSGPPAPTTFWGEHGKALVGALIGLIFGGVLTWLLKPAFEKLGNALATGLSRLGSAWGFRKRYLTHLIEEYRGLNIRGLKTKAPVTVELEHVYVSLRAQVPDVALGRGEPPAMGIGQAMARHRQDHAAWVPDADLRPGAAEGAPGVNGEAAADPGAVAAAEARAGERWRGAYPPGLPGGVVRRSGDAPPGEILREGAGPRPLPGVAGRAGRGGRRGGAAAHIRVGGSTGDGLSPQPVRRHLPPTGV